MKKKLIDYQKQWKARRGNILKAPFHVPDAKEHVEKDVYVIDKKALQEMVVDLQFNKKDLEHYDTLNSDATFLKESCKSKALLQQVVRLAWIRDALSRRVRRHCTISVAPA